MSGDVAVIVSCTKRKIWDDDPSAPRRVRAADAYTGPLFKLARKFVERKNLPWYIVSAKYGLIRPEDEIENYDVHISRSSLSPEALRAQAVRLSLTRFKKVIVLAGTRYAELVRKALEPLGIRVETPLAGLPIGRMLRRLKEMIEGQTKLDAFLGSP